MPIWLRRATETETSDPQKGVPDFLDDPVRGLLRRWLAGTFVHQVPDGTSTCVAATMECKSFQTANRGRMLNLQHRSCRIRQDVCARVFQTKIDTLPESSLLTLGKSLGEGTFGNAYETTLAPPALLDHWDLLDLVEPRAPLVSGDLLGPRGTLEYQQKEVKVVLKKYKEKYEHLAQMEVKMNQHVSAMVEVKEQCATYLGCSEVSSSSAPVEPGLWLVWRYEGARTLAHYLKGEDPLGTLANDIGVEVEMIVPTLATQLLRSLKAFHNAGLVHRDVKPHNMVFDETLRRFKLIDLGACADLRTGKNFIPSMSIMDRSYCPPEMYVLPTDSPRLAKNMFNLAMGPLLWMKHKPDRFDMWSAGVVLLQITVPSLRNSKGLDSFNKSFGPKFNYNLRSWRRNSKIGREEFELLDCNNGAGMDLVTSLLQPRHTETDDKGVVSFHDDRAPRISAAEALNHRFLQLPQPQAKLAKRRARQSSSNKGSSSSVSSSSSGGSSTGNSDVKTVDLKAVMNSFALGALGSMSAALSRSLAKKDKSKAEPEELDESLHQSES
eukprot:gene16250-22425_t